MVRMFSLSLLKYKSEYGENVYKTTFWYMRDRLSLSILIIRYKHTSISTFYVGKTLMSRQRTLKLVIKIRILVILVIYFSYKSYNTK